MGNLFSYATKQATLVSKVSCEPCISQNDFPVPQWVKIFPWFSLLITNLLKDQMFAPQHQGATTCPWFIMFLSAVPTFFFFGHTLSMRKVSGQGSNLSHNSDNANSLTARLSGNSFFFWPNFFSIYLPTIASWRSHWATMGTPIIISLGSSRRGSSESD